MSFEYKLGATLEEDFAQYSSFVTDRIRTIEQAPSSPLPLSFKSNDKAAALHPKEQLLEVTAAEDIAPGVKCFTLMRPDRAPVAFFRAGQYLSFAFRINGNWITRPYSICSAPSETFEGKYRIAVKEMNDGFASKYILDAWTPGTQILASGGLGPFHYERLRDAEHVIGVAGGSGITPFLSLAGAIRDGDEDFRLTILYGSRTPKDVMFGEELRDICEACPKVKVVNVYSHEIVEGQEHGFVTGDLIKKYSGNDKFSLFACGPQAMYDFLTGEAKKLGLARKYVRFDLAGGSLNPASQPGYPAEASGKTFTIKVNRCGETFTIPASANESVLIALERAGVKAESHCRSGECGWCHSKLISGNVFVPEDRDGRRAGDIVLGYIHICRSYPLTDLEIDIPNTTE